MNYELAKKLKDVGFPLRKATHQETDIFGGTDTGGYVYVYPTLSELIEACGDRFGKLIHYVSSQYGKQGLWGAHATFVYGESGSSVKTIGTTPEEALGNLWLSLQAKK